MPAQRSLELNAENTLHLGNIIGEAMRPELWQGERSRLALIAHTLRKPPMTRHSALGTFLPTNMGHWLTTIGHHAC
jgi:hypothetical protein